MQNESTFKSKHNKTQKHVRRMPNPESNEIHINVDEQFKNISNVWRLWICLENEIRVPIRRNESENQQQDAIYVCSNSHHHRPLPH